MLREPVSFFVSAFEFPCSSLINPTVTSNSPCWNKIYLSSPNAQSQASYYFEASGCSLIGETLKWLLMSPMKFCFRNLRFAFIPEGNSTKYSACILISCPHSHHFPCLRHITIRLIFPKTYFSLFIIKVPPLELSKLQLLFVT